MIDPQMQRRISHPSVAVSRPEYAEHPTFPQNLMNPQSQIFQNPLSIAGRGMSMSGAPYPMVLPPPHIPQQMLPMMAPVPAVPISAPLHRDDLSRMMRHLRDIDPNIPRQIPRRQSFPEPMSRGHLGWGPLLDDLDLLDAFDDDLEFYTPQFRRAHPVSRHSLLTGSPYLQQPHSIGSVVTPNMQLIATTPNAPMMFNLAAQRPYSYATDQSPNAGMYPTINQDLLHLSSFLEMKTTERASLIINVLVPRTPTEIEALRRHFRVMNGGTDLSFALRCLLNALNERPSVQYAFLGLVMGPVLYDLWLMQVIQRVSRN